MERPGMMKVEVTAKGRGGRKEMIDAALENLREMIDGEDMNAINSRNAPTMGMEGAEEMECADCKDGVCTDPDHNDEVMREMGGEY